MPNYRVTWEIDVEAGTPGQAARLARNIQLDPCSTADVFDVSGVNVDLGELKTTQCTNQAEQEAFEDLSYKVKELLHAMVSQVDDKLVKLHRSGVGMVDSHLHHGKDYTEPSKIVLALLDEMRDNLPKSTTKTFKANVNAYYLFL